MSASYPPPPAYEEAAKGASALASQNQNSKWRMWNQKFLALELTPEDASTYATKFVDNEIEVNMIPELTDDILKSMGIDKSGHRIRILRLKAKTPVPQPAPQRTNPVPVSAQIPRCAWHPNVSANEKCCKCHRLVCLNCRRQKPSDSGTRYFCQNCYDDCTIL